MKGVNNSFGGKVEPFRVGRRSGSTGVGRGYPAKGADKNERLKY